LTSGELLSSLLLLHLFLLFVVGQGQIDGDLALMWYGFDVLGRVSSSEDIEAQSYGKEKRLGYSEAQCLRVLGENAYREDGKQDE
jgi:hypothetical protein